MKATRVYLVLCIGIAVLVIRVRYNNATSTRNETAGKLPAQAVVPVVGSESPLGERETELKATSDPSVRDDHARAYSPGDLAAQIEEGIRFVYGRAVRGMRLPPETERMVWSYLIRRTEAGYIARQVAVEQQATEPLSEVIRAAQSDVDNEWRSQLGPLFEEVRQLVNASTYLNQLNQSYSNAIAMSGEPLRDEQVLRMARMFLMTYGTPNNPNADPTFAAVDDNGLLQLDYQVLERAAEILTKGQMAAFKEGLIARNNAAKKGKAVQ